MLPPAGSTNAAEVDALFNFINVISLFLLIGITIAIIYFAIRYRRRSDNDVTPVITHNNTLEITWSVIPLILVMIVFAWGYKGYLNMATAPDDAYEVQVTARSWLWEFHYPNGNVSIDELHVPANRPIKLIMNSSDVIHSFFVPEYRVKKDVLPNRYTSVWFEALETGETTIFCTEYCGMDHSNMIGTVVVHTQEDFDTWLVEGAQIDESIPPADRGRDLVQRFGCTACHSVDGSVIQGPSFQGVMGRDRELEDGTTVTVDENYIRESILDPQGQIAAGFPAGIMQSYAGILNDQQINDIIEYLKTLD